jgi:hypothetical protein
VELGEPLPPCSLRLREKEGARPECRRGNREAAFQPASATSTKGPGIFGPGFPRRLRQGRAVGVPASASCIMDELRLPSAELDFLSISSNTRARAAAGARKRGPDASAGGNERAARPRRKRRGNSDGKRGRSSSATCSAAARRTLVATMQTAQSRQGLRWLGLGEGGRSGRPPRTLTHSGGNPKHALGPRGLPGRGNQGGVACASQLAPSDGRLRKRAAAALLAGFPRRLRRGRALTSAKAIMRNKNASRATPPEVAAGRPHARRHGGTARNAAPTQASGEMERQCGPDASVGGNEMAARPRRERRGNRVCFLISASNVATAPTWGQDVCDPGSKSSSCEPFTRSAADLAGISARVQIFARIPAERIRAVSGATDRRPEGGQAQSGS